MRHLLAALVAPAWGIRTLHEAHQYARGRENFAADWRGVFNRGYEAGYEARKQETL